MVIEAVVSQDLGFGIVGRMNFAASVENSMRLVKIGGLEDIVWNDAIVLPGFCDRVDLNCQEDRDITAIKLAGEQYDCGRAPALAEEDDASAGFFFGAEIAVVVFVDEADDAAIGRLAVTVLEYLDVCVFRGRLSHSLCQKNRSMMRIVVPNEAPHKADEDIGRRLRWYRGDSGFRSEGLCRGRSEQEKDGNNGLRSSETQNAELLKQ